MRHDMRIDSEHAGGNIRVLALIGNRIVLEQDLRHTTQWWFYWNFCTIMDEQCTAEETIFEFMNGDVIGPWGPAISDDGVSWRWLGASSLISRSSFRYRFTDIQKGKRVYFAFGLPYQQYHFEQYFAGISMDLRVRREVLGLSEQLRPITLLKIGNPQAEEHIVLTCRHHACESTPSYLIEGVLTAYLNDPQAQILDRYLIHYVPFMDIDGVENGDQGKARAPHDHNRDYIDNPIYEATKAFMAYTSRLRLAAAIDFHSPFKWGGRHDVPFFVQEAPPYEQEIACISDHLQRITAERTDSDAIRHQSSDNIGFGVEWNKPSGRDCSSFFMRAGARLACTFELPYFGQDSARYTADSCRRLGYDFAAALETYLLKDR